MSVFMQPIYTQTIGASGPITVTFNNIPQGFTDLKIIASARGTGSATSDAIIFTTNGGLHPHTSTRMIASNTPAVWSDAQGTNNFGSVYANFPAGANTPTANFGHHEMTLHNYSGGTFKPWMVENIAHVTTAGTPYIMYWAGAGQRTDPITSITIADSNGVSFAQHSTFTLYGIGGDFITQAPTAPTAVSVTDLAGVASVAFTPAANDNANLYAITGSDGLTTYGVSSPIQTPVTVGTATTYTAKAINAVGTAVSSSSAAVTSINAFAAIATINPTGLNSAHFTNIPQNYKHLQIRIIGRSSASAGSTNIYHAINGEAGGYYTWHGVYGDGASVINSAATPQTYTLSGVLPAATAITNNHGVCIIDIYDYTSTSKFRTMKAVSGYDNNGSGNIIIRSSALNLPTPISNISCAVDATWAANSSISLYGIS